MSLPKNLKVQLLSRFDELIANGEEVLRNVKEMPPVWDRDDYGRSFLSRDGYQLLDGPKFREWRVKTTTILSKVIADGSVHSSYLAGFSGLNANNASLGSLESGISFLKAIKDDFERGFLDNLFWAI